MVVEKLAEIVEIYPLEVVKALKMIFESDPKGWLIQASRKVTRNILEVALQDPVKQEAEGLSMI